jgi:DNA-binding FadR family transcriptional regulator
LRDSVAHYAPAEAHMRRLKRDWMDDHSQIARACEMGDARGAVRILQHHLAVAAELSLGQIDRDPARGGKTAGPAPAPPRLRRPSG